MADYPWQPPSSQQAFHWSAGNESRRQSPHHPQYQSQKENMHHNQFQAQAPPQSTYPPQSQKENEYPFQQQQQQQTNYETNVTRGRKKYRGPRSVTSSISSGGSSRSRSSRYSTTTTVLDDPTFAPPPSMEIITAPERNLASSQHLPLYNMVTHSGNIMARLSAKSIILKKWKQVFWITYGDYKFLIFRSKQDFDEWVTNPYLAGKERDRLVKFSIDFKNKKPTPSDSKATLKGYRASSLHKKDYGKVNLMRTFKLEEWLNYGPKVIAVFASKSQTEIQSLRFILIAMMKRYKQTLSGFIGSIDDDSDAQSRHSAKSAPSTLDQMAKSNFYNQSAKQTF